MVAEQALDADTGVWLRDTAGNVRSVGFVGFGFSSGAANLAILPVSNNTVPPVFVMPSSTTVNYNQYVNNRAIQHAQDHGVDLEVRLQSGEVSTWRVLRLPAPAPLAYAETEIGPTLLRVSASGSAAETLEKLLSQLTRLDQGSDALAALQGEIGKRRAERLARVPE